ncbi:uncharacterized protein LY89DRAFT_714334 [Mollisia scopiformis]|uniref:Uncharacterized protein n=1 Tax=Mollisia scopiformis TaxID=149040 RepID=A0A194XQV6_MOLSC|nr:uncharacterized protein LY89DRAFT_714334 [Mollisia scopiformis]KUJ22563.1 hypothetical protein LY89DRAFT_714334 [Mollisia scopiformis]
MEQPPPYTEFSELTLDPDYEWEKEPSVTETETETWLPSVPATNTLTVSLTTNDTFHFCKRKLEENSCTGLLALARQHGPELILGGPNSMTQKCIEAYSNPYSPLAMTLFAEYIETGRLRPAVRHSSALSSHTAYIVLYTISNALASEEFSNLIIDEFISLNGDMVSETNPSMITIIFKLSFPDEPPAALKEMCLQYMANGSLEVLEMELEDKDSREKLKDVVADLALMLVKTTRGRSDHLVMPSRKNSCEVELMVVVMKLSMGTCPFSMTTSMPAILSIQPLRYAEDLDLYHEHSNKMAKNTSSDPKWSEVEGTLEDKQDQMQARNQKYRHDFIPQAIFFAKAFVTHAENWEKTITNDRIRTQPTSESHSGILQMMRQGHHNHPLSFLLVASR